MPRFLIMIGQMPQQLGAMPGSEPQAPQATNGPTSPPTAAGLLPQQAQPGASPVSPEDHVQALLDQFRALSTQVQALARQYPAASQDLATANDALINAMTKVISSLSAESSSAPQVLM